MVLSQFWVPKNRSLNMAAPKPEKEPNAVPLKFLVDNGGWKWPRRIFLIIDYFLIFIVAFASIIPIWHVLAGSFSLPNLLESNSSLLLKPLGDFTTIGYQYILRYKNIWLGYGNTIFYMVAQCVITGLLTLLAGYYFQENV